MQDQDPQNPRENDNLTTLVCFHKRYDLGDTVDYKSSDYNSFDELLATIKEKECPIIIKPLYMYDHSGLSISTSEFSCPWDSGQIGFAFIKKQDIDKIGCYIKDDESYSDYLARLDSYLESEVKEYNSFVSGDVYGYVLKNTEGKHVESCYGFYGSDFKENGLLDHAGLNSVEIDSL